MSLLTPPEWSGMSSDPNDEEFGQMVDPIDFTDVAGYDAVLVGEPYDGAVIGRPGTREGPKAIREALAGTKVHHLEAGLISAVGDLGDIEISAGIDVETAQGMIREVTGEIHMADTTPIFLGGDNSVTFPNVIPLSASGSVGVISLDAHFDCREIHEQPNSGTPYRQLHEAGLEAFAVVGARHFENTTAYAEYVDQQSGEVITAEDVGQGPIVTAECALEAMAEVERIYVSVDLDVLDMASAPGVSAPTPGGITTRELFQLVRALGVDERIAGFEVVECAPPLDEAERTITAAARAVAHFLAGHLGDDRDG